MAKKFHKNISQQQLIFFGSDDNETELIEDEIESATLEDKGSESECAISEIKLTENNQHFKFISFGSGSSGNSAYVGTEREGVLIDAGVDADQIFKSLAENNIQPSAVKGICITHDHGDHIKYAYTIARKYRHINIFCTNRVLNGILRRHNISRRIKDVHVAIFKEMPFNIAGLRITAFEVPHDGSDNAGFSVEYNGMTFAIATDLGHISERAYHYMTRADFLMIESNYDSDMLNNGRYPEYLKNRIRAANGHLDNADTARFLADNYRPELKYVFLCHLSNDNNTPEIARETIITALNAKDISVGEGTYSHSDNEKDIQLIALPRFTSSQLFILR
ncbi:MAG: MBL fold metallo-hydrolase [Bacteroidales bacterium]